MKSATRLTIIAAATIGITAAANATVSSEAPIKGTSTFPQGTGLLPRDIIVDSLGMTRASVRPSNPVKRVGCDANCSSNKC